MKIENQGSLTVELGSVNLSLDEVTALMSHKKKWLKSKGLKSSEENAEAYLRLALNTFVRGHPIHIPMCQYSGCNETRDIREFHSYEEGSVNLCKKHRKVNEGKTGYTVKRNTQE